MQACLHSGPAMSAPLPLVPLQPLPGDKPALLARLVDGLDAGALWWLSGYAAALAGAVGGRAERPEATDTSSTSGLSALPQKQLTVVYGSQTGNAKRVAERLAQQAEAAGLA